MHSPSMVPVCDERRIDQRVNHFGPPPPEDASTFRQRYFLFSSHYREGGPMFFYLGNEADVTLYVNATGLMWENAEQFGALVVFAEHRYYGESTVLLPRDDGNGRYDHLRFLTSEQALEDYVVLVTSLKREFNFSEEQAVIGFGGSYGGMLATWARLKYPHVFDGVIAGSAPVVSFEGMGLCSVDDGRPDDDDGKGDCVNPNFFAEGVTYDVTPAAGASAHCESNLRKAFGDDGIVQLAGENPDLIREGLLLCDGDDDDMTNSELGYAVRDWIDSALSYMAMGNFPYRSSYILNGVGELPPYPVRAACEFLADDLSRNGSELALLNGLAGFAGVYYNASGMLSCNSLSSPVNNASRAVEEMWDYQYCAQIFQIFGRASDDKDMYWNDEWDGDAAAKSCQEKYGFPPDRYHFSLSYGRPRDWSRDGASNIVWSQGEYDPWKGGGLRTNLTDSLVGFVIEGGAHHLDLFWSHENDTEAVSRARNFEIAMIGQWVGEKSAGRQDMTSFGRLRGNAAHKIAAAT